MTPSAHDDKVGVTLGGKYKILRLVGEGGMGAVYEALHLVVKRRFAVKFLRTSLTQRRDALLRFQREAAAAGALENENIAAVVDFGIADDGSPYIVMEYLAGCDLAAVLRSIGPLPVERATDIVLQVCLGIQQAHAAGVIHRDLKPENVFLCRRNDGSDLAKIVDFGIAKLQASDLGAAVTSTGGIVGTPSYMSPEQARGGASIDQRTDVYALGVILYELLSGHTPHPGDSYNAVIYHISTQSPLALSCQDRDFPVTLVEVVQRTIAQDPETRPASAEELSRLLTPYAKRQVWPECTSNADRPAPGPTPSVVDQSISGQPVSSSDYPTQSKRTRPAWIVAAGSTLLALLLAGGYFAGHPGALWAKRENRVAQGVATVGPVALAPVLPSASGGPAIAGPAPSVTSQVDGKRPNVTVGRPLGRPNPNREAAPATPSTNSTNSSRTQAKFDTSNPYE